MYGPAFPGVIEDATVSIQYEQPQGLPGWFAGADLVHVGGMAGNGAPNMRAGICASARTVNGEIASATIDR
jgi:hypothetical protein